MRVKTGQILFLTSILSLGMVACSESETADLTNPNQSKDAAVAPPAPPADAGPSDTPDAGSQGLDASVIAGEVELNTNRVNFGEVVVSSTGTFILTVRNPQMNPVRVSLSEPSGRNADRFTRTISTMNENGVFVLGVGETIQVSLTVSTATVGEIFASLALDSCMGNCPVAITLEATGISTGVSCASPVDFGSVNPGQCSTSDVVCQNKGNLDEFISGLNIEGDASNVFTLAQQTLPITVGAGSSANISVEYCPTDVQDDTATVVINGTSPTVFEERVTLNGKGGGPDIECTPLSLDFGIGGLNAQLTEEVVCTNNGTERLVINANVTGSAFSVVSTLPANVEAGDSARLTVQASAATAGAQTGTLEITSNDADTPSIDVALAAEFLDIQICTAELSPSTYDFGLVSLGRAQRASFLVQNQGASDCIIDNVAFAGGTSMDFRLEGLPVSGDSIAGGNSVTFDVVFTPTAPQTSAGLLAVSFSNPMTSTLTASLSGAGGDINLVASPSSVDFGQTPVGCAAAAQVRSVELTNVGTQELEILSVNLVGPDATDFAISPAVPANTALDRLETYTVNIEFDPQALGVKTAQLSVVVDGQASPTIVNLTGEGASQPARTDVTDFTSPKADVLFVIDDSGDMTQAQEALSANFSSFSNTLVSRGVDLHFAVVTTDMVNSNRQGQMIGSPAFVSSNTPNYIDEVGTRIEVGDNGDPTRESGIAAALRAVTPPLSTGLNIGFLRNDADLVVIILSSEDDQSSSAELGGSIEDAINAFEAAAGAGSFSVSTIVGPPTQDCDWPVNQGGYGDANRSPDYAELVTRVGNGLNLSFCEPMGPNLATLAEYLFGGPEFALSAEPLPSTVAITIDGTSVPAQNGMMQTVWSYNAVDQTVLFTDGNVPANGSQIRITYTPYCLSQTCGDSMPDPNEACDDGNMSNEDACTDGCRSAFCGDGFTWMGQEECDDANFDNSDACVDGCISAICGDGYLQVGVEECDDGNTTSGDGCQSNCVFPGYDAAMPVPSMYSPLDSMTATTLNPQNENQSGALVDNTDDGLAVIDIPFPFEYYGVPTSSVTASVNGLLFMDVVPYRNYADNQSIPRTDVPNGFVAPFWDDLIFLSNRTTQQGQPLSSNLSYDVRGAAPDRKLIVQWQNLGHYEQRQLNRGFRYWNFQVVLSEGTNEITLVYGPTEFVFGTQNFSPYNATIGYENQTGELGEQSPCSPNCDGRPSSNNPGDFPTGQSFTLTPR